MNIIRISNEKGISGYHNMTPEQRSFSRDVQREAYSRIPETCKHVRSILEEAQRSLMSDLEIDPADEAIVDHIMSRAFLRIRDEVTQNFRTEQMKLINRRNL